jgi:hypothetical protein
LPGIACHARQNTGSKPLSIMRRCATPRPRCAKTFHPPETFHLHETCHPPFTLFETR